MQLAANQTGAERLKTTLLICGQKATGASPGMVTSKLKDGAGLTARWPSAESMLFVVAKDDDVTFGNLQSYGATISDRSVTARGLCC